MTLFFVHAMNSSTLLSHLLEYWSENLGVLQAAMNGTDQGVER